MGRRRGAERSERERWMQRPQYDHGPGEDRIQKTEKVRFDDADTAFILGRGGKTKHKICRVSGAQLELHERSNVVDITGTGDECRKARKYIDLVRAQRVGPVHVDATHDDGDLTMIDVPSSCVGFVTGSGGNFLRSCEDEWGTLMFFCDYQGPGSDGPGLERLAIFGATPAGRSGAELKVMAAIETKLPGHFTTGVGNLQRPDEWGTDTLPLGNEELSFVLGQGGATRKKLARASGCILEYVGNVAFMVGTLAERQRARDYITWLMQQRTGPVYVDTTNRTDATAVTVPMELTGILKGTTLRDIEQETDTFCFLEGDVDNSDRLLIFGSHKDRRQAERKVRDLIRVRPWQPPPDDKADRYKSETFVKSEVRISPVLASVIDAEKLSAIQGSCGAKLTQHGSDYVTIEGYEHQVSLAKKQLHEYMYNLKVEEEFVVPKDVPFHVLIAKSPDGKPSVLEEVRNQTRVRVKVVQEERKVVLAGLFSVTANAKRELQTFLGSLVKHNVHLERSQLDKVSTLGKAKFSKMQHFRHLCAAQINKENCTLTLAGTPEAVAEAHSCVDTFFRQQEWREPTFEVYSLKHSMKTSMKGEDSKGPANSRKAAEILQLDEADSAFILGRGGKTKHKISKVSGAQLELHEQSNTVEIIGTDDERRRARKYVELVRAQRSGPVNVTGTHDDGDLTMINVPTNCVGFVTGSQGTFLRSCEEEWGTLMFFCDYHGPAGVEGATGIERLAIFGNRAGRTGAELKVMAAIETKIKGYFTENVGDECSTEEWGQDTLPLGDDELSFALGKDGSTRKKLARASGCILEYVGNVAFMAGSLAARKRVRDYLSWLMKQRVGTVYVDVEGRTDATVVDIPGNLDAVASVFKSISLRGIEQETRTFCFLEGNASKSDRLLIFSPDKACREKAKTIATERIEQRLKTQDTGRGGVDAYGSHWKDDGGDGYGGDRYGDGYGGGYGGDSYGDWDNYKVPPKRKGNRNYGYADGDEYSYSHHGGGCGGYGGYGGSGGGYGGYGGGGGGYGGHHDASYGQGGSYGGGYKNQGKKHQGFGRGNHDSGRGDEAAEVTDTFSLRGDISVHVVNQTGPNGEDPVLEDVETVTGTKLTLLRDKGLIQIQGAGERVAQAKRQLQQFADNFVMCKIQMRPQITAAIANKVSHYIRPMPWIAAAEVDETKDLLKIQGHQDSVDQTFKVLREVYRDHGLELTEADVVMKKKASEDHNVTTRTNARGKSADIIRVSELDAAFILGRGGKTKQKIARVSGATLELHERNNTVEIFGAEDARRKARKYVELVRAQRAGPVNVDESHDDGDLTMIAVPHNCVGFVTGSQGNFLRTCEDEWGTLMFFCDYQGPHADGYGSAERLAIFGQLTGRCGAELKVMAAIEAKIPGYYTTNLGDTHSEEEWGTDTLPLQSDQLSYALGKKGSTRRKLAKASGSILEYVGTVAFLAGTLEARKRGREYLGWLCDQVCCKTGRIAIDPRLRNDVNLVPVPKDCIGYVMGDKRNTLSRLEEDWETLIFFVDSKSLFDFEDVEGIAIFGAERGRAGTELKVMGAVETKLPQFFTKDVGDFHCPAPWGVDTLPLGNEELSFALGKDGSTRRKLARASGCILEYVGNVAYMAGTIAERIRAREYLQWLMRQRNGSIVVNLQGREDIKVIDVPESMKGMTKSTTLREVEKETGTFCFFQGDTSTSAQLLICGHQAEDRAHAEHILQDFMVRGASHPKPRKQQQVKTPHQHHHQVEKDPPRPALRERDTRREREQRREAPREQPREPSASEESASESETGSESESEYSSQSAAEKPPRPPATHRPRGGVAAGSSAARRRQWASEESNSGSDEEEIVPYW